MTEALGPSPRVHALMVTYNRLDDMLRSCHAVLSQSWSVENLVIVDNSASPVSEGWLHERLPMGTTALTVVPSSHNVGPAGGFALGLEVLAHVEDEDLLLLLDDDDPLPGPDVLTRLIAVAREISATNCDFGGVGLKGARFDSRWLRTRAVDVRDGPVQEVDHLHGGYAPLYRVEAMRDVGGFRPELFWGFEELDTGLRLTAGGHRLFMAADILSSYPKSIKDARMRKRPCFIVREASPRDYYTLRNLLWIGLSYGHGFAAARAALVRGILKPLCSLPFAPRVASTCLQLNFQAIKDAWAGRLGRTLSW